MGMVDYIELFIFAKCSLQFKLLALLSDPNFLSSYKLWNELGHLYLWFQIIRQILHTWRMQGG